MRLYVVPTKSRPQNRPTQETSERNKKARQDCLAATAHWRVCFLDDWRTIIQPGNIKWLMSSDSVMNLIGWMFFRNGPVFQQPFGAIIIGSTEWNSPVQPSTATRSRFWRFPSNLQKTGCLNNSNISDLGLSFPTCLQAVFCMETSGSTNTNTRERPIVS